MAKKPEVHEASNAGDKPLVEATAAEANQKAKQAEHAARIAVVEARLEEADKALRAAQRTYNGHVDNVAAIQNELEVLTGEKMVATPERKQADLRQCNQVDRQSDAENRKAVDETGRKVNSALSQVFGGNFSSLGGRRRVQKALRPSS